MIVEVCRSADALTGRLLSRRFSGVLVCELLRPDRVHHLQSQHMRITTSSLTASVAVVIAIILSMFVFIVHRLNHSDIPKTPQTAEQSIVPSWVEYLRHTAYGDQFEFSIHYPGTWNLGQFRGRPTIFRSNCFIELGAGGGGAGGWKEIDRAAFHSSNSVGTMSIYSNRSQPNLMPAITTLSRNYDFELQFPRTDSECLTDYEAILETFQEQATP
jgi:hypothetical protein